MSAQLLGPQSDQFSIVGSPLPSTLATGSTASLTVRFTPSGVGLRSATLRITSNDPDFQPYLVRLTATATAPEIVVEAPASLADGSSVALGTAAISAPALTRSFTIRNTGTGALVGLVMSKDGADAADFNVSALGRDTLAAGESQSFTVGFAPSASGPRTATLHLASNDADESPFDIVLTGQGTAMDLAFAEGGRVSRPSQDIALGTLDTGAVAERSFTLRNSGAQALTGLRLEITGTGAGQFTVIPALPSRLEAGASVSFTLRFTARVDGAIDTAVRLLSDQANEEPALLRIAATVRAAKMVVKDATGQVLESATPGKQVIAWGANHFDYGQTRVPAGLSEVMTLSAGGFHTVALKQDGSVVAWGASYYDYGQTRVPAGLSGVVAIAAGGYHTVALKQDGSVAAWGWNDSGQTNVPAGLSGVVAIAAGSNHTVALKQDGSVVAWGINGSGQTSVPIGLSGVVAIAAGWDHTVALKQNGSVVAWGWNYYGQTIVPVGLNGVVAIAAGAYHTVALRQDGSVVAWGANEYSVPAGLSAVVAISAGAFHTVALKQDGSIVAWGHNYYSETSVPAGLGGVVAIAAGYGHTVVIADPLPLVFPAAQLGQASPSVLTLSDAGTLPLDISGITLTGPDADQFRLIASVPTSLAVGAASRLTVQFQPTRVGAMTAQLHIASNDPATPDYVLNLQGTATYEIAAAKAGTTGAVFTYSALHADRSTGLMLQTLKFTNTTGVALQGLRLILSNVAKGVTVYSSSAGEQAGTLEVIYSRAIEAGEAITFDIVSYDPKRRISASMNPVIRAEALLEPEPDSLPVVGTVVPLRSVQVSPQGPWLIWKAVPRATYVVEYSDDRGKTWHSAVHRLSTVGTQMFWIDRGQPETKTAPLYAPMNPQSRQYRVKRL